jgi:sugar transferase (PEP-CTERM/EpsH1 system associated)
MKILMITHFVPYPPNSGALQRNFNLLREVAKAHEVYLVSLTQKVLLPDEHSLSDAIGKVSHYCKSIKIFKIPTDSHPLLWYMLLVFNVFSRAPYSVKRFFSRGMKKEIRKILKDVPIDLIHVDTVDLAQYVQGVTATPKVLNHHNIESELLLRRAAHAKNPFFKWYLNHQGGKVRHYEKRMIPQFDVNISVSPRDQAGIRAMAANAAVALVPNGTDTNYFVPSKTAQEFGLIFAGGLNWLPNADAMLHFSKAIFPLIRAEVPEVGMKIIGTNPSVELRESTKKNAIEVLGFVPDIREYMARAAVYVVPLRIGGGTRLKILDALAMGKAVVSTTIGAEGLELTNGQDILIADADEEFAQKVVTLLKKTELRKTMAENGRATVEKKYSWNVIGPQLLDVYSMACRK